MKPQPLFLLLGISLLIFPACKKNVSTQPILPSPFPVAFSTAVTPQEADRINDLLTQVMIKDPFDFVGKVDSIRALMISENGGKDLRKVVDLSGAYSAGNDQGNMVVNVPNYPSDLGAEDFITHKKTVYSRFQQDLTFAIRGNVIEVVVPFQFDWGIYANAGTNTISNVRMFTPIQLLPVGAYWGTVTPGTTQYINSGPGSNPYGQSASISAYANAQEIRTQIFSTTGEAKISTNANIGAFQIGAELSAGFTIQSVINIYNQYSMNAHGQIWIEGITWGYNTPPNTQFQGTVNCTDYGILQNQ